LQTDSRRGQDCWRRAADGQAGWLPVESRNQTAGEERAAGDGDTKRNDRQQIDR